MPLAWNQVRDDSNNEITYILATYVEGSKTDITLLSKGNGGICTASQNFPDDQPIFGGAKLTRGRFVSFVYSGDKVGVMSKGRASMHKNGVLNILEGCDLEIEVWPNMNEEDIGLSKDEAMSNQSVATCTLNQLTTKIGTVNIEAEEITRMEKEDTQQNPMEEKTPEMASLDSSGFISYEKLKTLSDTTSIGIDPTKKELALSDEEFHQVFQMTKESFLSLPTWKKNRLKKEAMLF